MSFRAPVQDYEYIMRHIVGYDKVSATERFEEAGEELTSAILTEAARLCDEVLYPLQRNGDLDPARLQDGVVHTSKGFAEGYKAVREGGWVSVAASPEFGGMGLPMTVTTAVNEMMSAACLSLALNPLMTQGQIEALEHHASEEIKAIYLPKLVSGAWCGTMNLTEAQAGSDVGALSSKAEDNGDGTYAITGQKIYISWGDNDFSENVCHLVLARLPGAPAGTKGISLFLVPKFLPDAAGEAGEANSLHVVSLEHKLGLHGSPTAVMQYDGATGWLVGPEGGGMAAMFTMMNNARLGVGCQGIGAGEGAYQKALAYAKERKQGRSPVAGGTGTIIDHADVRRMLATMRAELFAARSIALANAVAIDMSHAAAEGTVGGAGAGAGAEGAPDWAARAALLTPITKAFGTDTGIKVAEIGVQVHGGMGFIEETGAAQYARDVRVTAIYEGTNGIQSMDLVGRKLMDGGEAAQTLIDEMQRFAEEARATRPRMAGLIWNATETLREATEWMVSQTNMNARFAGSVPFLAAYARVLGGYYHLCAAVAEGKDGPRTKLARFYINRLLPEYKAHLAHAMQGDADLYALEVEDFEVA